jgi:signal transduction histidine kinase
VNLMDVNVTEQMQSKVECPEHARPIADVVAALSTIEGLNGLTEEEFTWLATHGTQRFGKDGDLIFSHGTPPEHLMFILRGDVLVKRYSSSPVSVLIGQTGRITGKTPFSRIKAWTADGRSSGDTWILELHESHFPELLTAIQSMTQRVVRVLLDRNREYTRLVTAVKDYSYMDRQPVQDVNIAKSLDTVLHLFQPRLAGIKVTRFYSPEVPLLQAFGSELNQAWAAIIENSLDAMGDSGTLTLSARLQGKTIPVEISDTGQGIPAECANRVFEPFFTTKPFGKGLGLGLDTVQRVIQKHFGAIAFDSKPGETTFHVRLPLDRAEVY